MIASPCKTCNLKNQPKEHCLSACKTVQALHQILADMNETIENHSIATGMNFLEEGRFVSWSVKDTTG